MSLATYLAGRGDRCRCGFHVGKQGCRCPGAEWSTFKSALTRAVRADGTVHQADVRPLIRGAIEPKHIGQMWRRARSERLVVEVGHERSDDVAGRNAGRMEPFYELAA